MKKIIFTLLGSIFIALVSFSYAWAAGSYKAEVPIASKSDADRAKGFVEAYKQALSDLSKDPKITNSPEVKSKLKNLNLWVQSYSYTKHPDASGQPGLFLKVAFDPRSIPEQLRSEQLSDTSDVSVSMHAENIPNVNAETKIVADDADNTSAEVVTTTTTISDVDILVWLATIGDNAKTNVIIDDTNTSSIANPLQNIAQKTGISITLPTMDLQDITKITADDVCDQDINVIKNASNRYGITKIAVGCIAQTDHGKRGQWLLLTEGELHHWDFRGNDESAILQQAFNSMAKVLMSKKTIHATPAATNIPGGKVISISNAAQARSTIPMQKAVQSKPDNVPPQLLSPTPVTTASATTNNLTLPTNVADDGVLANPNQTILYVNNINNLDQYADTVKYLRTIAGVTKVELLNIDLATIKLKVSINGGKTALGDGLKAQSKLTLNNKSSKTSSAANNSELNYNWNP